MTTTAPKTISVVMFLFIVGGVIASVTRLTGSASARETGSPEADPNRTVVLFGRVLGPDDRPIAGAGLYVNANEWSDPIEIARSNADGTYRVVVPEQKLRRTLVPSFTNSQRLPTLIVIADGFGPTWSELRSVDGESTGLMKPEYANDFHLVADFPITGQVVDARGKPVAGAAINVESIINLSDPRWYKVPIAMKSGNLDLMSRQEIDANDWFTPLYRTAWKMIPSDTTDLAGRFHIAGVGENRVIKLCVSGPGIEFTYVSALTRKDGADFTQAIRAKYPRVSNGADANGDRGVQLFGSMPTIEVVPAKTKSSGALNFNLGCNIR